MKELDKEDKHKSQVQLGILDIDTPGKQLQEFGRLDIQLPELPDREFPLPQGTGTLGRVRYSSLDSPVGSLH